MKTKFVVVAAVLAALVVGGVAWGFSDTLRNCCFPGSACCYPGSPCCDEFAGTTEPVSAEVTAAGCCVTGDCCCPGQGACCDQTKRASADVAKTLTKAAGCCSTGQCCCPGQGSCCATSETVKADDKGCCATKSKGDCCSK